jgi:hypothetical protein
LNAFLKNKFTTRVILIKKNRQQQQIDYNFFKKHYHDNLGKKKFKKRKWCSSSLLNTKIPNWIKKPKKISSSQLKLTWQTCNLDNQGQVNPNYPTKFAVQVIRLGWLGRKENKENKENHKAHLKKNIST